MNQLATQSSTDSLVTTSNTQLDGGERVVFTCGGNISIDHSPETKMLNDLRKALAENKMSGKVSPERDLDSIRRMFWELYRDQPLFDELQTWLQEVAPGHELAIWRVWVNLLLGTGTGMDGAYEHMIGVANVVNHLQKNGKPHTVNDYLTMMEIGGIGIGHFHEHIYTDPVSMEKEMDQLAATGNFHDTARDFAGALMQSNSLYHKEHAEGGLFYPTFLHMQQTQKSPMETHISITDMIARMQKNGYSEEQIHEVFTLHSAYRGPLRFGEIMKIAADFDTIDTRFPKGTKNGFIPYLESYDGMRSCQKILLEHVKEWNLPPEMMDAYLECAAEFKVNMGNDMYHYFENLPQETDPETFKRRIKKVLSAIEIVYQSTERKEEGWSSKNYILQTLLRCTEEEIDEARDSFLLLVEHVGKTMKGRNLSDFMNEYYRMFSCLDGVTKQQESKKKSNKRNFRTWAKTIIDIYTSTEDYFERSERWSLYTQLLKHGVSEEIAGLIGIFPDEGRVPLMEMPAGSETHEDIMRTVWWVRRLLNHQHKAELPHFWGTIRSMVDKGRRGGENNQRALVPSRTEAYKEFDIRKLKSQLATLETIKKQWEDKGDKIAACALEKAIQEVKKIISEVNVSRAIEEGFGIGTGIMQADSDFLRNAHPTVRIAAQGAALSHQLRGRKILIEDEINIPDLEYECAKAREHLPEIERKFLAQRSQMPGLMAIGSKIHLKHPLNLDQANAVLRSLSFGQTPFKLIHAGSSVIIPPMPTALETNMLLLTLNVLGIFEEKELDMQSAIGARLSPETSAILGATTLLATNRSAQYDPGAFSTTHDNLTGKRIMAYDAGVKDRGMPFDLKRAPGRTDILGRRSLEDNFIFQLVGTLGAHLDYDGPLSPLAQSYKNGLEFILRRHDLYQTMNQSAWVFNHAQDGDTLENHEAMIQTFNRARLEGTLRQDLGIMGQVRNLIRVTTEEFMRQRKAIIAQNPFEFEQLMQY